MQQTITNWLKNATRLQKRNLLQTLESELRTADRNLLIKWLVANKKATPEEIAQTIKISTKRIYQILQEKND